MFSEQPYDLSKANGLCSDEGATTILTADECRSAISKIPKIPNFPNSKIQFMSIQVQSKYPKGCYLLVNGRVFWNNHETGSPNANAHQVCTTNQGM